MKNLINKATSFVSAAMLFAVGLAMAGLGVAAISVLALFAFAAIGIALLASPFVAKSLEEGPQVDDAVEAATTA